jgi:exopolyphosphatase
MKQEVRRGNYFQHVSTDPHLVDLDSIASAVGYAYLSQGNNIIPMVQTPRDSLHLRPENLLAFSKASLDSALLVTSSDIPPPPVNQPSKYVLVDHNRLLPPLVGNVIAIIDHHSDEEQHLTANPRVIKPVGSCASLVTVQFTDSWKTGASEHLQPVALLLLSAILIDTGGLKAGGKATETDYEAAKLLAPHSGLATTSSMSTVEGQVPSALDSLSRQLASTKASVGHLSVRDLLRRDYKEYVIAGLRVGLATVPVGLKALIKRDTPRFWSDVESYMADLHLDILGVLTSYRSAKRRKHRRQLLFVVQPGHPEVEMDLFREIGTDQELNCEERRIAGIGKRRARCWRQGNVKATRKQVAPLVKRILESS